MSSVVLDFNENESIADMREPDFLKRGTYHLIVTEAKPLENEETGVTWGTEYKLQVVDGNVAGQVGKTFRSAFTHPSPSHKDGGKFAGTKFKVLMVAGGLIRPDAKGQLGAEPGQMVDMQLIAVVAGRKYKKQDGSTGEVADLDGMKMWHIDDPEVANIPKNAEIVANCVGLRWTPELIAAATARHDKGSKTAATGNGANGSGNGNDHATGADKPPANYNDL